VAAAKHQGNQSCLTNTVSRSLPYSPRRARLGAEGHRFEESGRYLSIGPEPRLDQKVRIPASIGGSGSAARSNPQFISPVTGARVGEGYSLQTERPCDGQLAGMFLSRRWFDGMLLNESPVRDIVSGDLASPPGQSCCRPGGDIGIAGLSNGPEKPRSRPAPLPADFDQSASEASLSPSTSI
jgi:hypothetical protein